MFKHALFAVVALVAITALGPRPAFANPALPGSQPVGATSVIRGIVRNESGAPVSGALVRLVAPETSTPTTTDGSGRYSFSGVGVGSYYVAVTKEGYQPQASETIYVTEVTTVDVNVSLQSGSIPSTLGRVTVRAQRGVQTSPVVYSVVPSVNLEKTATYRLFDAINLMPGLNPGGYNSAAPGDNASINIRGVGTLETLTLIDGHPAAISNSGCGCFEFNNAPTMSLKAVDVIYGSGAVGLYGVNAIGGVVDMRTLDPTSHPQSKISIGAGSYNDYVWDVSSTGAANKLGYAFNYGTRTSDGPLMHARIYNPSTSADPVNPALIPSATYPVDMGFQSRSILGKMRYTFSPSTVLTLSGLSNDTYDDKTGNGDNDYNPYDKALAQAQTQIVPAPGPGTPPPACVGQVDLPAPGGADRCFTPQQAASFFAGPQGGGPADQSFRLTDFHGNLRSTHAKHTYAADFYHGFYLRNYNRYFQLPGPNPFFFTEGAQQTGFQISDDIAMGNHELGFGYYIQHVQEARTQGTWNGSALVEQLQQSPYFSDGNLFLRDVISSGPLTTYLNAWVKKSSLTNTSHFDPRATFVYRPSSDNVWRATVGGGISQPNPTDRFASFAGTGAINPNCPSPDHSSKTNIGKGPGVTEVPETSADLELSYGHQWHAGSTIQATVYNLNLFNQLFATSVGVDSLGPNYVPPALLTAIFQRIQGVCPGSTPTLADLSVNITENLGRSRYKGVELNGTQVFNRYVSADYSYNIQSAVPVALDINVYKNSPNLIINSQLPFIPLHKASLTLNYARSGWEARIEGYRIGENNELLLPPYMFANFSLSKDVSNSRYILSVQNMFNSYADNYGYFGHGTLATNQYNPQNPNVLLQGYEQFHLPYRRYFVTYQMRVGG